MNETTVLRRSECPYCHRNVWLVWLDGEVCYQTHRVTAGDLDGEVCRGSQEPTKETT